MKSYFILLRNLNVKLTKVFACRSHLIPSKFITTKSQYLKSQYLNLIDCILVDNRFSLKSNLFFYHFRYHPHLMLSKSRFLFPLTSKRLAIIRELLRMSETYSMYPCYVARINRRVPLKERHKYPASNTVFMQTYHALKNKELNFR